MRVAVAGLDCVGMNFSLWIELRIREVSYHYDVIMSPEVTEFHVWKSIGAKVHVPYVWRSDSGGNWTGSAILGLSLRYAHDIGRPTSKLVRSA